MIFRDFPHFHEISRKSPKYAEIAKFHPLNHYSYKVLRRGARKVRKVLKYARKWKFSGNAEKVLNVQKVVKCAKTVKHERKCEKLRFGPKFH